MAGFRETIHLLIDIDGSGATSNIGRLRAELGNTEGAFNKMRVGATGAFDIVKQHAATAALAAGAAIVGFGVRAVGAFQETALGAGQLSDALGITMEEASRLQEVAGDLGIGVGTVETAIGKMNRTASTTPQAFDDIGAAIVRNADGTTNVIATFQAAAEAIRKIPDAADRAAAAQKIFGRSWQDISILIMEGADGIAAALDSVEAGKIMTDADRNRAERYRDVMDEIRGIVEEATIAIGSELVPAVTTVADAFLAAKGAVEKFSGVMPDDAEEAGFDVFTTGAGVIEDFKHNWEVLDDTINGSGITASVWDTAESVEGLDAEVTQATGSVGGMESIVDETTSTLGDASGALDDATDSVDDMATAAQNLDRKWAALKGQVSDDQAWVDIQDSLADVESAAVESFNAASSGAADAAEKARAHQSAVNNLKERVIEYGRSVAGIPPRQVSEILAMIDEGRLRDAENRLNNLARARTAQIRAAAVGNFAMFAEGGTVGSDGGIGGEAGPEIVERNGRRALLTGPTLLSPGTKVTPVNGVQAVGGVQAGPLVSVGQIVVQNGESVEEALERFAWRARVVARPVNIGGPLP